MAAPSSTDLSPARPRSLRVAIVQQIVPHYRVPLFDLLAQQPRIELTIWSGHRSLGSLQRAEGTGKYQEVDAPIRRIGPMMWQPGQIEVAKAAAGGNYDVVIFSWNARLVHLPRALRLCRRDRVPTLLWGHGVSKKESPWRRRRRNNLLRLAKGCILYNHTVARSLTGQGFDQQHIFVALNAIDQAPILVAKQYWDARPRDLAAFRSQHGLADRQTMLFVSRLEPEKRVDLLLRAFAGVKQQRADVRLAIIGRGPDEQSLRALASTLAIAEDVLFVGALYKEADLAPWFLSSACMPYATNLGLSLLHAFGYGLPVITCDDPSQHGPEIEALRDGENGLLYRTGDIQHFTAQILRCLGEANLRGRLAAAAFSTVGSPCGFCLERTVKGFMDAIDFAVQPPA